MTDLALDRLRVDWDSWARTGRSAGRPVVGYVCDNVPVELLRAFGFLPYRLRGRPALSRAETAERIAPYHSRRFAGFEYAESIFSGFVDEQLEFLDHLVVPHNRKGIQSLQQSVATLRDARPDQALPTVHYLDRAFSTSLETSMFNEKSLRSMITVLETWAGRPLDEAALSREIAAQNQTRSLLRRVNEQRGSVTPKLSGSEAQVVYTAAQYLDPVELNPVLEELLAELDGREPIEAPRVYLGGSPWDHPHLYSLIEDAGAVVVAEDHCWGARCTDASLPETDPIGALARRFDQRPACSILGSIDVTIRAVEARALGSHAQGAIFAVMKGDLAALWETPSELDLLAAAGLPTLHLRGLGYAADDAGGDDAELRDQLAGFVASLPNPSTIGAARG